MSGSPNLSACNPPQVSLGTRYIHVRAVATRNGATEVYSIWSDQERDNGEPQFTTTTFTPNDTLDAEGNVGSTPATLVAPANGSPHADVPVLQWRPVANATFYSVYLYLDSLMTTPALSAPFRYATTSTYFIPPASLPDRTAGDSYYWFVLPCTGTPSAPTCTPSTYVKSSGEYRTFTKSGLAVAGAADSGATKPGTQEFGLSWDDQLVTSPSGGGVKHYEVQLSTGSLSATAVNFTTDGRSIALAEQALTPGATYKWRVRAVDGSGIPLAWSAEQSFVAPTAPGPTVMTPAAAGATPSLAWTPTAAQESYDVEIYKGTDPTFPAASKVASPVSTSTPYTRFAIPTWLAAGDYSWRVRTIDSHGKASTWTSREGPDRSGALLTFTVSMPAPTIAAPASGGTVAEPDLVYAWAPVPEAVKYRVEIGRGNPWAAVTGGTVDVVGTSYSPTTRLAAGDYSWRVSAMTGATGTNLMSSSALVPFTLQTTPGIPGSVAVTLAGTAIGMSWTAPSSGGAPIQGYLVRYKVGPGEWTTQTLAGDAGSFTLNNVALASTYTLQVAAQNSIGRGAFTAAKSITTASPPGAPTLLKGTASGTKLTVTWSAPSSTGGSAITGYLLGYRLAGTSAWTEIAAPLTRTLTLSDLLPSTTYELQVAAVNAVGQGPWATQAVAQTGATTTVNHPDEPHEHDEPFISGVVQRQVPGRTGHTHGCRGGRQGHGHMGPAHVGRRCRDHRLHGDQHSSFQDLHGLNDELRSRRADEWDRLPVHCDGPELRGSIGCVGDVGERHPRTARCGAREGSQQEGKALSQRQPGQGRRLLDVPRPEAGPLRVLDQRQGLQDQGQEGDEDDQPHERRLPCGR